MDENEESQIRFLTLTIESLDTSVAETMLLYGHLLGAVAWHVPAADWRAAVGRAANYIEDRRGSDS